MKLLFIYKALIVAVFVVQGIFAPFNASAHCEIPCGIYDDELQISLMKQHITTIEKSMKQIIELSKSEIPNHNQMVRWVNNKEKHAEAIQKIVTQYFLFQRIKPLPPNDTKHHQYLKKLELLHHLLVASMKTKQTTDLKHIKKLRKTTEEFENLYFEEHGHKH